MFRSSWLVVLTFTVATSARAFTIDSAIGQPCHERISSEALRRVRAKLGLGVVTPVGREKVLFNELPFKAENDMQDVEALTLLIGVRDPDLKGVNPIDLQRLAVVHGHPKGQREHCLRHTGDNEPGGSASALADCHQFIRDTALYALDHGLGSEGQVNLAARTRVAVYLEGTGEAYPDLPLFWVYTGQTMHAIQDSFTHSYRDVDLRGVSAVLNWVDYANDSYDERLDGPPHDSALDTCDDSTERSTLRKNRAIDASEAVLLALLAPGDRETKVAALDAVLASNLSLVPGCSADNRWCDATEHPIAGCSATGGLFVAAGLLLLAIRRRGLATGLVLSLAALPASGEPPAIVPFVTSSGSSCVPGLQVSCGCLGGGVGIQQCQADGATFTPCECPAAPPTVAATELAPSELRGSRFGLYASASISIDQTAFATNLAARYRINEDWLIGAGAEWNPWFSFSTRRLFSGTLNVYASLIKRWPINDRVAARTSAHLGTSVLLFGLYGAPAGNIGLYAAVNFIGLEVRLSKNLVVVFDPCEVAMPVPHLTGVPITYRQYRFTIGLQLGG